jgi:hypothetical protein
MRKRAEDVTCLVIRLKKYRKAKVALSLAATFCF